jgi:hypothetical protein
VVVAVMADMEIMAQVAATDKMVTKTQDVKVSNS